MVMTFFGNKTLKKQIPSKAPSWFGGSLQGICALTLPGGGGGGGGGVGFVYVIGWSTVVFGINSTSNAVRKCKIARGEAECYLLPDCIASAINPKYHSRPSYHRLILHLS